MPKITHKTAPSSAAKSTPQVSQADAQSNLLKTDLIQLIDDVAEFADLSVFINHALTTSLSRPELLNPQIAAGARICSALLQNHSAAIQGNFNKVHARHSVIRNKGVTA